METKLKASEWLDFLHRGGKVAHFWCANPQPTSTWFENTIEDRRRAYGEAIAVHPEQYVSINPSYRIPPHNKSGNTDPRYISKQIEYIQCINVLHCEYDGKDWCKDGQDFYADPDLYKAEALAHIYSLPYAPTLIVDSGGGYHCYWYLRETVNIDDTNRQSVIDVQHWWVLMNGGDVGVSDITRVYRVIGSKNMKPGWKGNYPTVTAIEYDPHRLYSYPMLAEIATDWHTATQATEQYRYEPAPIYTNGNGAQSGQVRELFNQRHGIADLLQANGYKLKYTTKTLTRLARPGETQPSVSVFPSDGVRPEISRHHSTNDPLHRDKGHDAYSIYQTLTHRGDWKAAYVEAKKDVGLWEEEPKPSKQASRVSIDTDAKPQRENPKSSTEDKPAKAVTSKKEEWLGALAELGHTFALNLLEDVPEMDGVPLSDIDRSDLYLEMKSRGVPQTYVDHVINVASKANAYHPVQQYLNGLTWDGEDHLVTFLDHLTGDDKLVTFPDGETVPLWRVLITRWLLGCVARALEGDKENPFKHQTPVLVFVGGQDIGKSSIPRWLCSGLGMLYHREGPVDPHRADDVRSMVAKWIWEVSELGSSLRRADRDALKSFITQEWHTYRKPWGKGNITKPTLCNLVGTINDESFLDDPTGSRRFLPVKISYIDHSYAQKVDVNQLWAQLVAMYREGHSPALLPEEKAALSGAHAEHQIENPLQTYIQMYFDIIPGNEDMKCFTADIVARLKSFNVSLSPDVKVAGKQVGEALAPFGLERRELRIGGVKGRAWVGISPNMKTAER